MATRPPKARPADAARAALVALLETPPMSMEELTEALAGIPRGKLRAAALEALATLEDLVVGVPLLSEVLSVVGVEGAEADLLELAGDPSRPVAVRAMAVNTLNQAGPPWPERVQGRLSEEDQRVLFRHQLDEVAYNALVAPESHEWVVGLHAGLDATQSATLLPLLEAVRTELGAPAAVLYRPFLEPGGTDHHDRPRLQELVAEEGSALGERLLAAALEQAASAEERTRLDDLLARCRMRRTQPGPLASREPPRARITSCDGEGAFMLQLHLVGGGHQTALSLNLRVHEGVVDGFSIPGSTAEEFESLGADVERVSTCRLIELPASEAARLVLECLKRDSSCLEDPELAAAVTWVEALRDPTQPPLPQALPRAPEDPELVDALLAPEHHHSWILDDADTELLEAAPLVPGHPLFDRLRGMCRHMAMWEQWRGESARAAAFAGLEADLVRDASASALLGAMLADDDEVDAELDDDDLYDGQGENDGFPLDAAGNERGHDAEHTLSFGSPSLRDAIRERLMPQVRDPRGEDLARLDFTEAAMTALIDALHELDVVLPEDPLPVLELAHVLGAAMAHQLCRGSLTRHDMPEVLERHAWIPPSKVTEVLDVAMDELRGFHEQVCGSCPVRCLDAPDAPCRDAFFADEHPVNQEPT